MRFSSITPYESHRYGYDELSNLRADTNSTTGVITSGSFITGNRLASWGGTAYEYDADGNRIERDSSANVTNYDWTAGGLLYRVRSYSGSQEDTIHYDYNAFGQLVRRRMNGTVDRIYLWDAGQLLAVLNGTATAKLSEYAYRPGTDQPLAYITGNAGGTMRYFLLDERGNVIGLASSNQPAQYLLYDPWGRIESQWGVPLDSTGLGWKGLLRETGSGLYYVRTRWYDVASRSFISEDPIGISGGLNTYAFTGNDPVNRRDPSGMDEEICQGDSREVGRMEVVGTGNIVVACEAGDGSIFTVERMAETTIQAKPAKPSRFGPVARGFDVWASGILDAAIMSSEYIYGTGPEYRSFGSGTVQVEQLRDAPGVNGARNLACSKLLAGKNPVVSNYAAGFGVPGLLRANYNGTRQFVGSYRVDIGIDGAKDKMWFVVTNKSSFTSLTNKMFPSWERSTFPLGGNMYQVYQWSEPLSVCS